MPKIYHADPVVQATALNQTRDLDELTTMYQQFTGSAAFRDRWPNYGDIPLMTGFGGRSAAFRRGSERWIRLGSNRSESVLLHEIAHHVHGTHPDQYVSEDSHGTGFATAYLDVVEMFQGEQGRRALTVAYGILGIKVWRDGKRVMLPSEDWPDGRVGDALVEMADTYRRRKAADARRREARREDREFDEQMIAYGSWDWVDNEYRKRERSEAARRAWATRRARQAAYAAQREGK